MADPRGYVLGIPGIPFLIQFLLCSYSFQQNFCRTIDLRSSLWDWRNLWEILHLPPTKSVINCNNLVILTVQDLGNKSSNLDKSSMVHLSKNSEGPVFSSKHTTVF